MTQLLPTDSQCSADSNKITQKSASNLMRLIIHGEFIIYSMLIPAETVNKAAMSTASGLLSVQSDMNRLDHS